MSLTDQVYDIISEDADNFEQLGLDKLLSLWPNEHKSAVLQAQKEGDWDSDSQIELSRLCEQIASADQPKFLADLKLILANMYS